MGPGKWFAPGSLRRCKPSAKRTIMKKEAACQNCYFYVPQEGNQGLCQVIAPSPVYAPEIWGNGTKVLSYVPVWPLVSATQCCGQYSPLAQLQVQESDDDACQSA